MDGRALLILPVVGIGWWTLGFWPGGWLVVPVLPSMPVTPGMLIVLGTVVIGLYGFLAWYRENI
jgi:hypothetical protein